MYLKLVLYAYKIRYIFVSLIKTLYTHYSFRMKEKIFTALKNKFKNLGFGDKAFEGVAAFLATTITEEDQIETGITGVEGLLKGFQGDSDKRVNDAVTKAKTEAEKKVDPNQSSGGDSEPKKTDTEVVPDWAKSLLETNKQLASEVSALKSGKTADARRQTLESKLKDAQPKLREKILKDFSRMSFEKDEDFDTYLTETESDLADFNQSLTDQGLGQSKQPFQSSGGNQTKAGIEADIVAWGKANAPAGAVK